MRGIDSPCYKDGKECGNRCVGCHATCKKYIAYKSRGFTFHSYNKRQQNIDDYYYTGATNRRRLGGQINALQNV